MTSVPHSKQELTLAIESAFDKLIADYSSIPKQYTRTLGVQGNIKGTEISVNDTLAYLIGWGKLVLKWYQLKRDGQAVDFPESGYQWNELGLLAQRFFDDYKDWTYETLIAEFTLTIQQILVLIDSLSNKKLYGEVWYKHYTLGKMIQFNTSSPMKNVRTKIRKFKKTSNII